MHTNRMARIACAVLALVIALTMPALASADEVRATAKAASPTGVELSSKSETILPGAVLDLTARVLPMSASQSVSWSSNNTAVATVSGSGRVIGKKNGTAKITATTKTGNRKASCMVHVATSFNGVDVHFYGIGNTNYPGGDRLPSCVEDLNQMAATYGSASFGGKPVKIHKYPNQTGAGMIGVLDAMIADPAIGEDDITVFFYSGHGVKSSSPTYHGALVGIDSNSHGDTCYVTVNQVQQKLDQVPGTIIVILDSCFSGQFIKAKGEQAAPTFETSARAANSAWIAALASSRATNFSSKALPDSGKRTKYRIMTASSNNQESVGFDEYRGEPAYSLFAYAYYDILNNRVPGGKVVTLNSLFRAVSEKVNRIKESYNRTARLDERIKQVTCVWPSNNNFPVFARN